MSADAVRAVREALELLGRASGDWRNGSDAVPGPLHWPVAVHHARKRLQAALEALESTPHPSTIYYGELRHVR